MHQGKIEPVWLKLLGGKLEHAGLGISTIAFLVALLGARIVFAASERNAQYWIGYALGVVGVLGGWVGIIGFSYGATLVLIATMLNYLLKRTAAGLLRYSQCAVAAAE